MTGVPRGVVRMVAFISEDVSFLADLRGVNDNLVSKCKLMDVELVDVGSWLLGEPELFFSSS